MARAGNDGPIGKGSLDNVVDTILDGVSRLLVELAGEINGRFDQTESRLQKVEKAVLAIKKEINDINSGLSTVPSRREFDELQKRVGRIYPPS